MNSDINKERNGVIRHLLTLKFILDDREDLGNTTKDDIFKKKTKNRIVFYICRSCFSALHVGAVRCLMTIVDHGELFQSNKLFQDNLHAVV